MVMWKNIYRNWRFPDLYVRMRRHQHHRSLIIRIHISPLSAVAFVNRIILGQALRKIIVENLDHQIRSIRHVEGEVEIAVNNDPSRTWLRAYLKAGLTDPTYEITSISPLLSLKYLDQPFPNRISAIVNCYCLKCYDIINIINREYPCLDALNWQVLDEKTIYYGRQYSFRLAKEAFNHLEDHSMLLSFCGGAMMIYFKRDKR